MEIFVFKSLEVLDWGVGPLGDTNFKEFKLEKEKMNVLSHWWNRKERLREEG